MGRLHTGWSQATKDPSDGSRILVPASLWRAA
jgi:hypothetical protein